MSEILWLIAVLVAGYAAKKWLDDYDVRSAYNKIVRWRYDKAQIKRLSSSEDFTAWLKTLPDTALRSKDELAIEALIGANLPSIGPRHSEPLSYLGVRLYRSWRYEIEGEIKRRSELKDRSVG